MSAFEQSLSNMTTRLHSLTATAERKVINKDDFHRFIEEHPLNIIYERVLIP